MKCLKSFTTGFLTCTCFFLIMGQTKADNDEMEMNVSGGTIKKGNEYGRYQAYSAEGLSYMIETNTGFKYRFNPLTKKWMKQSIENEIFNQ